MSDNEGGGRKGGYRLDYATTNRAGCKGPKPCAGTKILKGELRVGSLVDFRGNTTWVYRHWGCVTPKVISNMKEIFDNADDLDGFEDLKEEDQERVRKAWEEEHVADEDIPESARKPKGEEGEEEEEEEGGAKKTAAKKKGKTAKEPADEKGVIKLEYASSGRSKCKACKDQIGKDFFRLGDEVDFRGHKSIAWQHWGCTPPDLIAKLKRSYDDVDAIDGFAELKDAEKDKVRAAWEADEIPEEDQGPGEAVEGVSKKAAPRKPKKAKDEGDEDAEERPKKRARKAKKEEDEDEEEEEKPKAKRAPAKKAAAKPAKKRVSKKKKESDEESAEDFGDEIANVSGEEEEQEEEETAGKKRKRVPASKASSSKTASKPASKRSAKPPSSRGKKQVQESDEED